MKLRMKLAISMCALFVGLVAAQFPSHVAKADISICSSCDAAAIGDGGGGAAVGDGGGGIGLGSTFGTP
jgi:hypothetical protein